MKFFFHYLCLLCFVIIICVAIVCVKCTIAEVNNICLLRASYAIFVRDKMRLCLQKRYKMLLPHISDRDNTSPEVDDNNLVWLPIKTERYGPQKKLKKSFKKINSNSKKNNIYKGESQKELLTHRGAPFSLPLVKGSFWISSRFGPRRRPDGSSDFHYGIDLAANRGTSIYAVRSGLVTYAGCDNGYGNTIVLKHGAYFKTRYAHLDKIFVKKGETIGRGVCIGSVGATGHIRKKGGDGSHLHFEVSYCGKRVDPLQFLPDIVS